MLTLSVIKKSKKNLSLSLIQTWISYKVKIYILNQLKTTSETWCHNKIQRSLNRDLHWSVRWSKTPIYSCSRMLPGGVVAQKKRNRSTLRSSDKFCFLTTQDDRRLIVLLLILASVSLVAALPKFGTEHRRGWDFRQTCRPLNLNSRLSFLKMGLNPDHLFICLCVHSGNTHFSLFFLLVCLDLSASMCLYRLS